jgi:enoyl-CoA hydratase
MSTEGVRRWTEENLAWIEVNRPEKLNALDRTTLLALRAALQAATSDPEARVILLTGAGDRSFIAGADIAEMAAQDAAGIRGLMDLGKEAARLLEEAPQPALAVVNGYALGGGCELALACDLVLASEGAQFGLPEVDLAVLPGWGGTQRLERRVGYGRARRMVLTGERVRAFQALEWGLCDMVFPPGDLRVKAAEMAGMLASKDGAALAAAKRALRERAERPLKEGLALETDLFVELFGRPEREARMGGFLKRKG